MYEKLLVELAELLRLTPIAFSSDPLIYQLIAWVRSSKRGLLDGSLAFNSAEPPKDAKHLGMIFHKIGESSLLDGNSAAFGYVSRELQHIPTGLLIRALELISERNLLEPWPIEDLTSSIVEGSHKHGDCGALPRELTQLMTAISGLKRHDRAYIPFEQSFQLTGEAQKTGAETFSETRLASPFPWLINLLSDTEAKVHVCNSLAAPGFLDDGRLTQFDVSLAFPPFGVRYEAGLAERDHFERFPEATTSGAVLSVRHLLARTRGRIVVAVQNGLLFSPGAERALRDDLLAKRVIEAVVALPPALLVGTAIPFSLLILNTTRPSERIVFVDGCHSSLFTRDGKSRSTLTGWKGIANAVLGAVDSEISTVIATTEVIANDAQLQVARYCKPAEVETVDAFLSKYSTSPLVDVVDFIRPIPPSPKDGTVIACEVSPADFPEFGYAHTPSREISLTEISISKGKAQFLRPLDVAITIKGNLGKVAILSPETPYGGEKGWVAGQSCLVLRIKNPKELDPRFLYSYLKSEIGQTLLRQLATGAAVQLIQLRELQNIPVPMPDMAFQGRVIKGFEEIDTMEKQVIQLRDRQRDLSQSAWIQ